MAFEIPDTEPAELIAGDTWAWDKTLTDYPASDGWQLAYALRGKTRGGTLNLDWDDHVTAAGDGFEVRVPAAETGLAPDTYDLLGFVTKGAERYTPIRTRVTLLANPASVRSQSHASQMVALLESVQKELAAHPHREVTRGERSWTYDDRTALATELASYRTQVLLERNPNARIQHAARFARS